MEIQQHDGVVVDVAGLGRASPSFCERERCSRGEGGAQGCCVAALPPLGGRRPWEIPSPRGAAAKGVACPPSQVGRPPPLGFPTLGAGGGPRGAPQPTKGWFPSHFSPWGPPG